MLITTFGTRGSLSVCSEEQREFGGNTTCVQVESPCLPEKMEVCIDCGSGFLPFTRRALQRGLEHLVLLFTHYHHDHTCGFLIAPPVYIPTLPIEIFGPVQPSAGGDLGPEQVMRLLMQRPIHPVEFAAVSAHLNFHPLAEPEETVIVIHPHAGFATHSHHAIELADDTNGEIGFRQGVSVPLSECLSIRMHYTDHPEFAIGFRITEHPSGKTFVFVTDEEVRDTIPASLERFIRGADLLIQDAQYNEETYRTKTKGFGHGTPDYVVRLAEKCGVKNIGITHHDPTATDAQIKSLVSEGLKLRKDKNLNLFACRDGQEIKL